MQVFYLINKDLLKLKELCCIFQPNKVNTVKGIYQLFDFTAKHVTVAKGRFSLLPNFQYFFSGLNRFKVLFK